ncbi:nitrous oxide reductase accessory protein NosL [Halomonas koreensis]|uniref:Nitrous oxide reductase accessory protein NosL n=1 Tax=Halomonas koreensis TaxID=245385 RepID=A0ABU1G366_9GAMM|nr:nitrous oxide reductase accessory protein NosL [Halomonas koreensis]MDR5866884.1 nitrous oxide reductase accessory protein NosL [Halomonas koreensis]
MFRLLRLLPLLLIAPWLAGCGGEPETAALAPPQAIDAGDSCHVCGMLITEHPGPKGQAFLEGAEAPRKFCSTLDLFVFLQQPENASRLSHAYVHDIGITPWGRPADEAFIRADEAWYVVGHERRGSMGHTLASFAERQDAEAFRGEHGGEVIAYADIDLDLLGRLGRGELEADAGMAHHGSAHAH